MIFRLVSFIPASDIRNNEALWWVNPLAKMLTGSQPEALSYIKARNIQSNRSPLRGNRSKACTYCSLGSQTESEAPESSLGKLPS